MIIQIQDVTYPEGSTVPEDERAVKVLVVKGQLEGYSLELQYALNYAEASKLINDLQYESEREEEAA
jgi:hypothetical protein